MTPNAPGPETNVAFDSADLKVYYIRPGGNLTPIQTFTQTVNGGHTDGGFVALSAANAPGIYRLDLPDAVCAAGVPRARVIVSMIDIANGAVGITDTIDIDLVGYDPTAANLPANVTQWSGTNVATPDTAGYPKVTVKNGAGAGEIATALGAIETINNVHNLDGDTPGDAIGAGLAGAGYTGTRALYLDKLQFLPSATAGSNGGLPTVDANNTVMANLTKIGGNAFGGGTGNTDPHAASNFEFFWTNNGDDGPLVGEIEETRDRVITSLPNIAPGSAGGLFRAGTNSQTTVTGGFGAGSITNSSFANGAIDATAIAAGAITSSEAPNLDTAVSSRVAASAITLTGGRVSADVTHWLGTPVTTNVGGTPKVDVTHVLGSPVCE